MKELRAISWILSLSTLAFLGYGAVLPGRAAGSDPVIEITEPVHGQAVKGAVAVSVTYRSVSGANITHLQFYVDRKPFNDVKVPIPAKEGSYSFVWDTTQLSAGPHHIWAYAIDAQGRAGNVAISIYIKDEINVPAATSTPGSPAVSIRGLRDGQVVGSMVQVMADVLGNVPVKWVEFHVDDRFRGATNQPPYTYRWDTTRVQNGPHALKVYVYDASDNRGESTPVVVEVNNPTGMTTPGQGPNEATQPPVTPPAPRRDGPGQIPMSATTPVPPATTGSKLPFEIDIAIVGAGVTSPKASPLESTEPPTAQGPKPAVSASQPFQMAIVPTPAWTTDLTPVDPRQMGAITANPVGTPAARVTKPMLSTGPALPPARVAPGVDPTIPSGAAFRPSDATATEPAGSTARPSVSASSGQGSVAPETRDVAATIAAQIAAAATASPNSTAGGSPRVTAAAGPRSVTTAPSGASRDADFQGSATRSHEPASAGSPNVSATSTRLVVVSVPGSVEQARADAMPFSAAELRTLAPSAQEAPRLDPTSLVPQVLAMATSAVQMAMAPSAGELRTVMPFDRSDSPVVSAADSSSTRSLIALVDTKQQRAIPVAMLVTRSAEPPTSQRTLPADAVRPSALPTVVVTRKAKSPVSLVFNGKTVRFDDVDPVISQGMTLAPFRHMIEHSGGHVAWNSPIKQVKASADGRRIEFTIGDAQAMVNDRAVQMQAAPFIREGRAIVPVSFLRDALNVTVEYDPQTGKVTIAAR